MSYVWQVLRCHRTPESPIKSWRYYLQEGKPDLTSGERDQRLPSMVLKRLALRTELLTLTVPATFRGSRSSEPGM